MTLRIAVEDDVAAMVELHATSVAEGFLPTLGPAFLSLLHGRIVSSTRSFAIVAEHESGVVGFTAATQDLGRLYREFFLRDGLRVGARAGGRLVRALPRVIETIRYPTRHAQLPRAEILVVAVAGAFRGEGIGRALVDRAVEELDTRGVGAVRVVTTAGNEAALRMYSGAGFRPTSTTEVHRGTESVVLVRPSASEVPR